MAAALPLSTIAADYDVADRHHRIWRSVDRAKRLSDRVVGIGPFGIGVDKVGAGLDGLLSLVPARLCALGLRPRP